MSHRRTLSSHQVDLLRWIGDGCPPPAPGGGGVAYRISAAALHRRGLVRVTGRGPAWNASLAPKGREYLDQVDGDDPPDARQANHSVTQQLVDDVIAAGGSCRFPQQRWHARGSVDFERRARLAEVYGKVPAEKRLVVRRVSNDEIEVVLEEAPGYVSGRLEVTPVRVPTRVGRYHAAARWFRERTERHEVSRSQLARATRLIHAIAMEADRRGWQPGSPVPSRNGYGRQTWTATKDGHLRVSAGAEHFWFRLKAFTCAAPGRTMSGDTAALQPTRGGIAIALSPAARMTRLATASSKSNSIPTEHGSPTGANGTGRTGPHGHWRSESRTSFASSPNASRKAAGTMKRSASPTRELQKKLGAWPRNGSVNGRSRWNARATR